MRMPNIEIFNNYTKMMRILHSSNWYLKYEADLSKDARAFAKKRIYTIACWHRTRLFQYYVSGDGGSGSAYI